MSEKELPDVLEELSVLLRAQLGVRGTTFAARLRRAGRRLPKRVREAGARLVEREVLWENPKLRRQVEPAQVAADAAILRRYLQAIDVADRRRGYWLGVATPLAFNLLVLGALAMFLVPHLLE